jgi:peptidylprolyl isomerase
MRRVLPALTLAALLLAAVPAAADRPPRTRPVIVVAGTPPAEPGSSDLRRGDGRTARRGDTLVVDYVGAAWTTGREVDSSWDNQPFRFRLGAGEVIEGWDRGLRGMREGGRRRLIIPPGFAYGAEGSPPSIRPDETLVFVVDLIRVCRGERRCRTTRRT